MEGAASSGLSPRHGRASLVAPVTRRRITPADGLPAPPGRARERGCRGEARGSGGFDARFAPDGSTSVSTFGIDLLLTLPGKGAVFLDAGRAEFLFDPHVHVLFEAGPQEYDLPAFCAALAP